MDETIQPDIEMYRNDEIFYIEIDTGKVPYARQKVRWAKYENYEGVLLIVTSSQIRLNGLIQGADAINEIALFTTFEELFGEPRGEIWQNTKGYVVVPDSLVTHNDGESWLYSFVEGHGLCPPDELPPFRSEYVKQIQKPQQIKNTIANIRAYIAKIESIEGKNGSAGLVRAAAKCRDAGLNESETTIELLHWNRGSTVNPPWSEPEIARAVTRVFGVHNHAKRT
ncbi:MAG: hypothetical protein K0U82_00070 [Planctomycetes bacterium]|nr:hypothetical protein [Planctomycetota bacterium]